MAYKAEIGEETPTEQEQERLREAIIKDQILFYGAWDGEQLAGCCSVTIGFSYENALYSYNLISVGEKANEMEGNPKNRCPCAYYSGGGSPG